MKLLINNGYTKDFFYLTKIVLLFLFSRNKLNPYFRRDVKYYNCFFYATFLFSIKSITEFYMIIGAQPFFKV